MSSNNIAAVVLAVAEHVEHYNHSTGKTFVTSSYMKEWPSNVSIKVVAMAFLDANDSAKLFWHITLEVEEAEVAYLRCHGRDILVDRGPVLHTASA